MNTVFSPVSRVASHVSLWGKSANPGQSDNKPGRTLHIDAEEFSDHMLRDIGLRDGRRSRGEQPEQNDLNALLREYTKRSL